MSRRAASLLAIIVGAALLTIALFGVIRYMTPASKPLGEGPRVHLPPMDSLNRHGDGPWIVILRSLLR